MADGQAFDMEEYIRKRMLEITSLKDREALKQVAGDILTALYDYNKDAYHQLEDRILKECSPDQNHYAVHICLTDRQHYDETDTFLYPMRMEDTKKTDISCRDIQEALAAGGQPKLYTVFIQCSASQIYQLLHHDRQQGRFFNGTVRTDRREYKAVFTLQQNTEYLQMVEELYAVFGANFQPWFTVCTAYLTKMLDV